MSHCVVLRGLRFSFPNPSLEFTCTLNILILAAYILILFFSPHIFMQVKKIMNQVFQSLRGEFELEESYNGRTVLGTIMNTIKVRQLLMVSLKWVSSCF